MKLVVALFASIFLLGCATSLPVPSGDDIGQFVVPVSTDDKSDVLGMTFTYTLRYINEETQEKGAIDVIPRKGLTLAIEKNLPAGDYCFYAYFAKPIEREGYTYTYAAEDHPIDYCFEVKAGQMNIWSHQVSVFLVNTEQGYSQGQQFNILTRSARDDVEEELNKLKNIELWQPVYFN